MSALNQVTPVWSGGNESSPQLNQTHAPTWSFPEAAATADATNLTSDTTLVTADTL